MALFDELKARANEKLQFRTGNKYAYVNSQELTCVLEAIAEVLEPIKHLADNPRVMVSSFQEMHVQSDSADKAGEGPDSRDADSAHAGEEVPADGESVPAGEAH